MIGQITEFKGLLCTIYAYRMGKNGIKCKNDKQNV